VANQINAQPKLPIIIVNPTLYSLLSAVVELDAAAATTATIDDDDDDDDVVVVVVVSVVVADSGFLNGWLKVSTRSCTLRSPRPGQCSRSSTRAVMIDRRDYVAVPMSSIVSELCSTGAHALRMLYTYANARQ
jgi:hypothetical protein